MKNRVAKFVDIKTVKIFEENIPKLKPHQVLVKLKSVGICGSDIHYYLEGGLGSFKLPFPMYVGHEPAGVVVDSYSKERFQKGDRVVIEPGKPCLECRFCLDGKHNLCLNGTFMAANLHTQGAIADYVVVDEIQLVKIPVQVSFNKAALLEPLGVALHAINFINPKPTESAVIYGAGPIGLSIMSVLKKFGMSNIYLVDKLPYRVRFAKKMGAFASFKFDEAVSEIKALTNGQGTTYAFDAAGNNESVSGCTDLVGVSGSIVLVGIPTEDLLTYNPHKLRTKEIKIYNVRRSNQTVSDVITLFKDDKMIEKMVTHEFKLEDVQKAFDIVSSYDDDVIKCVIKD